MLNGSGSADAHTQIVKDRATAALQALGYAVVHPAVEGGAMEVEENEPGCNADNTAAQEADTRDAPDAQRGSGDDLEQRGERPETAVEVQPEADGTAMEVAAEADEAESTWTSEQSPGAYVFRLTRDRPQLPKDCTVADELDTIIAMAQ